MPFCRVAVDQFEQRRNVLHGRLADFDVFVRSGRIHHGILGQRADHLPLPENNTGPDFFAAEHPGHNIRFRTFYNPNLSHALRHRVGCGVQFGLHAAGGDAARDQMVAIVDRQQRNHRFIGIEHARNIGQENQTVHTPVRRNRDRHRIAIHVEDLAFRAARHACHHGHVACAGQRAQKVGVGRNHPSDEAQIRIQLFRHGEAGIDSGESHRFRTGEAERGNELRIHSSREDFKDRVDSLFGRDAQTAYEVALDAALFEKTRHLLAAAVHHRDRQPDFGYERDLPCEIVAGSWIVQQAAADFDQRLHSRPAVSSKPAARLRFWIA